MLVQFYNLGDDCLNRETTRVFQMNYNYVLSNKIMKTVKLFFKLNKILTDASSWVVHTVQIHHIFSPDALNTDDYLIYIIIICNSPWQYIFVKLSISLSCIFLYLLSCLITFNQG